MNYSLIPYKHKNGKKLKINTKYYYYMEFTFKGKVMKVGNSLCMSISKHIVEAYDLKKGQSLDLLVTDKGIYIPLKEKKK